MRTLLALLLAACAAGVLAQDVTAFGGLYDIKDGSAKACIASAKSIVKSGNSIVDTRCALVAFEVCMHEKSGIISQSQDAPRQCAMMKSIGGAQACAVPCAAVLALPTGGTGKVGKYTGLTEGAVRCHDNVMSEGISDDPKTNACASSRALQCLMNGSASPAVNAAIQRERLSACRGFAKLYPDGGCGACRGSELGLDYDKLKAADTLPGVPGVSK